MLTSLQCQKKYGPASDGNPSMVMWDVPSHLEVGVIPKRLYCNKDLVGPLTRALTALIQSGHVHELKTWDGCFNIRKKRGGSTMSLHSWGVAIDVNAAWNCFGCTPRLSPGFVKCFTDNGFDWGGTWRKPDGMHFQLKTI
jgi:hypothetical protein